MSLDNSEYIIYRAPYKDSYLTIFRFKSKYDGLSSILKLIDFPIFLITILIFILKFRSFSLIKKLIRGDFEIIKKNNIPEHELELLKNYEYYPTKEILEYLYSNSKKVSRIIKIANLSHTRWIFKYYEHLLNLKLLEKYSLGSKYISFIGIMPFPSLLNFNKSSFDFSITVSFWVSALPIYLMDIIKFILFALSTNKSIIFTDKGINTLKTYKLSKNKKVKVRKKIVVSIYFFREIEHLYEIVSSLSDNYEFIIIALNRVTGIESFFKKKGLNIQVKYIELEKINYIKKLLISLINNFIYPFYILLKKKKLHGSLFYPFVYNLFSLRTTTRILCLKDIIKNNFNNFQFLSFNTWELPFLFFYDKGSLKTFGRYCLVPGVNTSQYFRPHDYILSINKMQTSQFSYLNKKRVILLGKKLDENLNTNNLLNENFSIKSKKYMVWIGTKRCPGMSNEILYNSLRKTIFISKYFGLKLLIRSHPTITKSDTLTIFGDLLKDSFIFDNSSPLEKIAQLPALFSLTTSTADLTILKYLNPCVCLGLGSITYDRIGIPYHDYLGELCSEDEKSVIESLKRLEKKAELFKEYKQNISKYLDSICFINKNFDKDLSKIFRN